MNQRYRLYWRQLQYQDMIDRLLRSGRLYYKLVRSEQA